MNYYICHKYYITNRMLQPSNMPEPEIILTTTSCDCESMIDFDGLMRDENVKEYLRRGLAATDPMAQVMMCIFSDDLQTDLRSILEESKTSIHYIKEDIDLSESQLNFDL